jgi:hypothetical protein
MKALLGILGLVAVAIAIAHQVAPPQPAVVIDVPTAPLDDLNLNGAQ